MDNIKIDDVKIKITTKPTDELSEWVIVRGMIADGKYAYRNDNCLWVDALEDLPGGHPRVQ